MGVLYNVLFKPIGRGDGSTTAAVLTTTAVTAASAPAVDSSPPQMDVANDGGNKSQPDWVLDRRDGGTLVWRRYDPSAAVSSRRRVEFLDDVQVRVYERDDYSWCDDGGNGGDDTGDDDDDDDDDGQMCCNVSEWSSYGDYVMDNTKRLRYGDQEDDYPVLVAMSMTVLGLCIGLAYMFAPVRWLLHQLLIDD